MRLPNPWTVPVVTVPAAGRMLGYARASAYRHAAAGSLPTIELGGRRMVPTAKLYALLGLPIPPRPAQPAAYSG